MKEVHGTYNDALIYTDRVDDNALTQVQTLCNQPFAEGSRIRIMPDVHAGAGCTIGTTMTILDKVVPNLVGVDIGCGMETVELENRWLELQKLDKLIAEAIPSGRSVRKTPHRLADEIDLHELRCFRAIRYEHALRSIGSLGGGNHFIEAAKDDDGHIFLTIHSGSRHLGLEVAKYYQEEGYEALNGRGRIDFQALVARYKAEGREREIQAAMATLKKQNISDIPFPLAYVEGPLFEDYIHDMKIVQRFAMLNRQAMLQELVKGMKLKIADQFTTIHNYIDTDAMILRKGAVSAKAGEILLIPINMRDGSLICRGKGNPEWNFSAPHGAGRLYSRTAARQSFTVSEFKKQMAGIYTTSVRSDTLDECPMAYKTMEDIVENIGPTAEILKIIRPIYNFKAGEDEA